MLKIVGRAAADCSGMTRRNFLRMIQLLRALSPALVLLVLLVPCRILAADKPLAFKELQTLVDQRLAAWQPTPEEKRFDEIGWCTNLLEAEKLSREHHRPIFLFTHDGRMNVGRC